MFVPTAPKTGQKPKAPRFTEKLRTVHVVDGSVVQMECRVEGEPRPTITWFRQTAIIKPSTDFQVCDTDGVDVCQALCYKVSPC